METKKRMIGLGEVKAMRTHRKQLERKLREVEGMLTRLNHPLLPGNWTAADARELAGELAKLMGLLTRAEDTVFDASNPYPGDDVPLEDIPYYNPYFNYEAHELEIDGEIVHVPAYVEMIEDKVGLWTEILYCAILIEMCNPEFCISCDGAFAGLKELLSGIAVIGDKPVMNFGRVLNWLSEVLSEAYYQTLAKENFGPRPPVLAEPRDPQQEAWRDEYLLQWRQWTWLNGCPHLDELRRAIADIHAEERRGRTRDAVLHDMKAKGLLSLAIDLYLYQTGVSEMLDDGFYVTYAMLCRTQKEIEAATAAETGEEE